MNILPNSSGAKVFTYTNTKASSGDTTVHTVSAQCQYAKVIFSSSLNGNHVNTAKVNAVAVAVSKSAAGPQMTTPFILSAIAPAGGGEVFYMGEYYAAPGNVIAINCSAATSNTWLTQVIEFY